MRVRLRPMLVIGFLVFGFTACTSKTDWAGENWPVYLGDKASRQYSGLSQIDTSNVHALELAWVYNTGDMPEGDRSQIQCNPLVIDGVLYGTSPQLKLFALDAATGEERWVFDPFARSSPSDIAVRSGVNRGVVHWGDGDEARILFTAGNDLIAVDAVTGRPISAFGTDGRVDLRENLGWEDIGGRFVLSNTPGIVYEDLLILGMRLSEGPDAAPGPVRAYNVRTGELAWKFNTIPRPGEYGYETWPQDAWKTVGGANPWTGMSLDEERGIVYVPTGSAAFDFYGGNRIGKNLFANTLLALDAATGERVWHFQFVHHDIWDRDLPAPPNLIEVERNGTLVDAVAQTTKSGHIFVFDRESGEPLFDIEQKVVPASDVAGEQAWPTQPFPVKPPPFARQHLNEETVTNISEASRSFILDSLEGMRHDGQFIPPSLQGSIIFPGLDGGGEWGGTAYDPESRLLFVNGNEMAWVLQLIPVEGAGGRRLSPGESLYLRNCAQCHGVDRLGDASGQYPSLVDVGLRLGVEEVHDLLETGQGFMPAFQHLTREDREEIVNFIMDVHEPPKEPTAQVEGTDTTEHPIPKLPYVFGGYKRFVDPEGYPAVRPPWGTLNAIDMDEGEIVWTVPLGELPELTAKGIPVTGAENYGGPIVTAGGVLFIGASKDEMFRAFDMRTGRLLWETKLPAGGYATPSTYMVDGRQYVVIAAGGGKMGTASGDAYIAFALPGEEAE